MDAVGKLKVTYEAMKPTGETTRDPDFGARAPASPAPSSDAVSTIVALIAVQIG